jgi:hypothetical protein
MDLIRKPQRLRFTLESTSLIPWTNLYWLPNQGN